MTLDLHTLRGDIFGVLTAAVVALPVALAFGVASGLGPAAGMYSAIAVGFFAAVFGGTRSRISGPTAPMTVACSSLCGACHTASSRLARNQESLAATRAFLDLTEH